MYHSLWENINQVLSEVVKFPTFSAPALTSVRFMIIMGNLPISLNKNVFAPTLFLVHYRVVCTVRLHHRFCHSCHYIDVDVAKDL